MVDRTDYRRASAVVAALVFVFASAPAAAKADELDTFAVRGNSVPEWLAYINRAKQQQPTGKSPDAVIAFTSAQQWAIINAADRILVAHAGEPADRIAQEEKLAALWTLVTLGDKQSEGQLVSVAKTLQNDSRPSLRARRGIYSHLAPHAESKNDRRSSRPRERGVDIVADVERQLTKPEFDERLIVLADQLTTHLEHPYPRLALSAATDFAAALASRDDAHSRRTAEYLAGRARRWRLVGQTVEIQGSLVGGGRLDGNALRGHIVLLYFWATWCEPCVAELPAIKAFEAPYRARGLKLISVSLDDDTERLGRFLADRPLPWRTVSDTASKQDGRHALSAKLSVDAVPTAVLLDKHGRVVGFGRKPTDFWQDIERLLAEPEAPAVAMPNVVEADDAGPAKP